MSMWEFCKGLLARLFGLPAATDLQSVIGTSAFGARLSILNVVVFAAATAGSFPFIVISGWATLAITLNLWLHARSMEAMSREVRRVSPRTVRLLIFTSMLSALPWAALPWMHTLSSAAHMDMVVICVICGMTAGGVMMLSRVLAAAAAYSFLVLSSALTVMVLEDPSGSWGAAIYCAIYGCALVILADYGSGIARDRERVMGTLSETVEELEHAHEKIMRLAFVDTVTGLPNRKAFLMRLDDAIARLGSDEPAPTLFFFDLDRFKTVNDSLGHVAGDALLTEVGTRIKAQLPHSIVARLGGDEFAALVDTQDTNGDVAGCARALLERLSAPMDIRGREIFPGATLGIAEPGTGGTTSGDLLHAADIALRHAKDDQRGTFMLYETAMGQEIEEQDRIERQLRRALNDGHISVYYQPQVCLHSGVVVGAEALLRWIDPTNGLISPGVFLPVAEDRGLAFELSERVFEIVERDATRFRRDLPGIGPVAINIFPADLKSPKELLQRLHGMRDRGLGGEAVRVEVTENCIVGRGTDEATMTLDAINELGFDLSLDDFGTGHASLSHLKRLPVQEIKIDREFVSGLGQNRSDQAIVTASIEIARCMGLACVAEGVETKAQLETLRELGATVGQGYLWSPAVPAVEFCRFAYRLGTGMAKAS